MTFQRAQIPLFIVHNVESGFIKDVKKLIIDVIDADMGEQAMLKRNNQVIVIFAKENVKKGS